MAGRQILLRDESGREHRATVSAEHNVTVGDVEFEVRPRADGSLHVQGPVNRIAWTAVAGGTTWVFVDGGVFTFEAGPRAEGRRRTSGHVGPLTAPMPATVRKVSVAAGDTVRQGDVLVVLEAMKMELPIRANIDGVVAAVHCREGEMVQPGIVIVEVS